MIEIPVYANMVGVNGLLKDQQGNSVISFPQQYRGKIKYLNISNTTENQLKIYAPTANTDTADPILEIGSRMMLSVQLMQSISEGIQVTFTNPNSTTTKQVKPLTLVWSEVSKNWSHSLAQSYFVGSIGDTVGINSCIPLDINSLPALPVGDNNIGNVDIASPIPAGVNNIGKVDVNALPALSTGTNNIGSVNMAGSLYQDITFHNADTTPGAGSPLSVLGFKSLTVEISGTSTSRTLAFFGRGPGNTDIPITGIKTADFSTAATTTGTGELWQFDVTGITTIYMNLQAVAGGNVTVKGRLVA